MDAGDIFRAVSRWFTLNQIWLFQLDSRQLEILLNCRRQLEQAAEMTQSATAGEESIYGTKIGFGKLANTQLSLQQRFDLRK